MTETYPIHKYLAKKYKPELLGANPQETECINICAPLVYVVKIAFNGPLYFTGFKDEAAFNALEKLPRALDFKLNKGAKFIAGDFVSWLDFVFIEYLFCIEWLTDSKIFAIHPCLKTYKERMCALPGFKEYYQDPNCREHRYTFNKSSAKLNNRL
jgi:glutathione S-transferase